MSRTVKTMIAIAAAMLAVGFSTSTPRSAAAQSAFTLSGEWLMISSARDGQIASRLGNTLGFPDREMRFEVDGNLRTGVVLREDVGANVRPLGVWRIYGPQGNLFSATFQLWCPDGSPTCGTVIMRGEFTREDRVRGTMTVFFDTPDPTRPTGLDTWVFDFRGERHDVGGASRGSQQ